MMRGIKKGLSQRRLSSFSFQSSDPDTASSAPDKSQHNGNVVKSTAEARRRVYRKKSSLLSSVSSNSSDLVVDILPIDPDTQELAIKAAEEKKSEFRESLPKSLLMDYDTRDIVAPFRRDELILGPKLGAGEFSSVFEVLSFACNTNVTEEDSIMFSIDELDQRLVMKRGERYRQTKKARYAIKHIKLEYCQENDAKSYIQAASDLALEAEFLASLQHPNIIKLRGITQAGAAGFEQGPGGYFLVLDRLFETLDQRLKRWRTSKQKSGFKSSLRRSVSAISKPSSTSSKEKENELLDERLNIALQISSAMKYLHSHQIIFRDLKPANIGFDVRGDVKLFDFGLARVFPGNRGDGNLDTYEMSGAGSPRYMAPECLNNKAYNLKADVYSFSIVFWQILSAQTPYAYLKRLSQLVQHVVYENVRPLIDHSWPSDIQGMLESSFDSDISKRPKMSLWYKIIHDTLVELRGGDGKDLNESYLNRRRSFESMKDHSLHQWNILKDLVGHD